MTFKSPTERIENHVEFLAEQDGVPERELKSEFSSWFQETPSVYRAYLAVVRYGGKPGSSVALCLVAQPNSEADLIPSSATIFSKMFSSEAHLDIIVVNELQEVNLAKVCRPFFIRNGKEGNGMGQRGKLPWISGECR